MCMSNGGGLFTNHYTSYETMAKGHVRPVFRLKLQRKHPMHLQLFGEHEMLLGREKERERGGKKKRKLRERDGREVPF